MALIDDLKAARDSLGEEIRNEQARRAALTAAGKPPPLTYSIDGRSTSYGEWLRDRLDGMRALNDEISRIDTGEGSIIGYSGY